MTSHTSTTRRVIRTGNSLAITLPANLVKLYDIREHDLLESQLSHNHITIMHPQSRKVMRTGGSLLITIPHDLAKVSNLKPGDPLDFQLHNIRRIPGLIHQKLSQQAQREERTRGDLNPLLQEAFING